MRSNKGFTLIEFMIVAAIIAIITAVIMPRFMSGNKETQKTAEQTMFEYATHLRPDLNNWSQSQCTRRDTNNDDYVTCTISGKNKKGEYQVIAAECAAGWLSFGNEGCKPQVARIRQ